jgi:hypothetical protein
MSSDDLDDSAAAAASSRADGGHMQVLPQISDTQQEAKGDFTAKHTGGRGEGASSALIMALWPSQRPYPTTKNH